MRLGRCRVPRAAETAAQRLLTPGFVPAGLVGTLVGGVYLRFLWRLPAATRRLFIAAGATYLAGAVVLESVGGFLRYYYPDQILARGAEAMAEEMLEMGGIILFLYALVAYLTTHHVCVTCGPPVQPKTGQASADAIAVFPLWPIGCAPAAPEEVGACDDVARCGASSAPSGAPAGQGAHSGRSPSS